MTDVEEGLTPAPLLGLLLPSLLGLLLLLLLLLRPLLLGLILQQPTTTTSNPAANSALGTFYMITPICLKYAC